MDYKKGDLVIIDGYATYHVSYKDIRGIIIESGVEDISYGYPAKVLIEGKVVRIPHIYIKHAEHNNAKGTHIQAR